MTYSKLRCVNEGILWHCGKCFMTFLLYSYMGFIGQFFEWSVWMHTASNVCQNGCSHTVWRYHFTLCSEVRKLASVLTTHGGSCIGNRSLCPIFSKAAYDSQNLLCWTPVRLRHRGVSNGKLIQATRHSCWETCVWRSRECKIRHADQRYERRLKQETYVNRTQRFLPYDAYCFEEGLIRNTSNPVVSDSSVRSFLVVRSSAMYAKTLLFKG